MAVHVSTFHAASYMLRLHTMLVDIIKVLGEGGFSFVYLARDEHSGVSPDFHTAQSIL
jgi:hypothetical protein